MIFEQSLEAADIRHDREDQQEERKGDGKAAPRQRDGAASGEHAASTGDENEENGEHTGNDRQRNQPAGDELPRRQGEEKEVQRLAKNRVHNAASGRGRVPEERER